MKPAKFNGLLTPEALNEVAKRQLPPQDDTFEQSARTYRQSLRTAEDQRRQRRGENVRNYAINTAKALGAVAAVGLAVVALKIGADRVDNSAHIKQEKVVDPRVFAMEYRDTIDLTDLNMDQVRALQETMQDESQPDNYYQSGLVQKEMGPIGQNDPMTTP